MLNKVKTAQAEEPQPKPPASEENPQKKYFSAMWTKQRFSPTAPLVASLTSIHRKINKILNNPRMKASVKVRRYNALMSRSAILLRKSRSVGMDRRPPPFIPPPLNAEDSNAQPQSPSSNDPDSPAPEYMSDDDDEEIFEETHEPSSDVEEETADDFMEVDEKREKLPTTPIEKVAAIPLPPSPVKKRKEEAAEYSPMNPSDVERMESLIDRTVPETYKKNVKNLYKHIAREGRGLINWTKDGEVYVSGKLIPNSDIIALLTQTSRPKSTKATPVGYDIFYEALKKINPSMKYVRRKETTAFTTPTSSKPQKGKGLKIKWRTRL